MSQALSIQPVEPVHTISAQLLALFPQELLRDAQSPYLGQAHLDVPRHDTPLVAAFKEYYPELETALLTAGAHLPTES